MTKDLSNPIAVYGDITIIAWLYHHPSSDRKNCFAVIDPSMGHRLLWLWLNSIAAGGDTNGSIHTSFSCCRITVMPNIVLYPL